MEIFKRVNTSEKTITGNVLVGVALCSTSLVTSVTPRFTAGVLLSLPW